MRHEFHFIVNEELYFNLLKVSIYLNKSLSSTITYIFENINTFIEKNHLMTKEKDSRFKIIADLEEKRYDIHCYLPDYLYRKMKHIHHDLNVYGKGQIIRKIISSFLRGCNKYGIMGFVENWKK